MLKNRCEIESPYNLRMAFRDSRYGLEVFKNSIIRAWRLDLRIPILFETDEDLSLRNRRFVRVGWIMV